MVLFLTALACFPELPDKIYPADPNHDYDGDGLFEVNGDCDEQDPEVGRERNWYVDVDGKDELLILNANTDIMMFYGVSN